MFAIILSTKLIWEIVMSEFFGVNGYQRMPEGAYSWQHLTFGIVGFLIVISAGILLGRTYKNADEKKKNLVLLFTAIVMDTMEVSKIILVCVRIGNPMNWIYELPLFLCSIQLIAIPFAALTKGRIKEAALDFIFTFGVLGALLGTLGGAQIFNKYPVLSYDVLVFCMTHLLAGFAAVYIAASGMTSMKKKNLPITMGILVGFCVIAYIMYCIVDYNYMFLVRSDGTPYQVLYDLVGGNPVLYPIGVVLLFFLYIFAFNLIYHRFADKKKAAVSESEGEKIPEQV